MDASILLPKSKTQKLFERENAREAEDIISKLPDSVLHHILSFLPTKDAVGTSILSTRWQYLWTSISNIDFDDSLLYSCKKNSKNPVLGTYFVDFVERVLLLRDASYIKRLRLWFSVRINASRINSWISVAIKHKVQELDLSLPLDKGLVLPHCLFTCKSLTTLRLETDCVLKVPTSICFPSLKSLHLSLVTFFDDHSTQLFSSCPLLQELALVDCGWKNVENITICIPTLKSLTICYFPFFSVRDDLRDCKIKIYALNLISLNCSSNLTIDFLLCNLSSLVDASIDLISLVAKRQEAAHRAVKLLSGTHSVKCLTISTDTLLSLSVAENIFAHLPIFYNLTRLEVNSEFSAYTSGALMDFLKRSPNLEFLYIAEGLDPDISFVEEDWILKSVPCCFKSGLKSFRISFFSGNESEMHFLRFLLKNATVLERMMIYCLESLSADLKKLEEMRNQLQMLPRGSASCVIVLL